MDERQINRYLRRQLRGPAWFLTAYYILLNLLVIAAVAADSMGAALKGFALGEFLPEPDMAAVMGNAWGYIVAVAAAMLILLAWKGNDFWHYRVMAKGKKMGIGTFAVCVCFCLAAQLVNSIWISGIEIVMSQFGRSVEEILESVSGSSDTFSMFLYASFVAPISEELIFRGFVQRSLEPYGRRFSILGSAFLFGVFHGNLLQIPYAFLVGLLLGHVAAEYHIGWAIGLHVFNNLVLADLLTRATASLSLELIGGINLILFGLGAVISGIVLLVKRREISAHIAGEWMDRRCVKCFFTNSGVIVLTVMMAANALLIMVL